MRPGAKDVTRREAPGVRSEREVRRTAPEGRELRQLIQTVNSPIVGRAVTPHDARTALTTAGVSLKPLKLFQVDTSKRTSSQAGTGTSVRP